MPSVGTILSLPLPEDIQNSAGMVSICCEEHICERFSFFLKRKKERERKKAYFRVHKHFLEKKWRDPQVRQFGLYRLSGWPQASSLTSEHILTARLCYLCRLEIQRPNWLLQWKGVAEKHTAEEKDLRKTPGSGWPDVLPWALRV